MQENNNNKANATSLTVNARMSVWMEVSSFFHTFCILIFRLISFVFFSFEYFACAWFAAPHVYIPILSDCGLVSCWYHGFYDRKTLSSLLRPKYYWRNLVGRGADVDFLFFRTFYTLKLLNNGTVEKINNIIMKAATGTIAVERSLRE